MDKKLIDMDKYIKEFLKAAKKSVKLAEKKFKRDGFKFDYMAYDPAGQMWDDYKKQDSWYEGATLKITYKGKTIEVGIDGYSKSVHITDKRLKPLVKKYFVNAKNPRIFHQSFTDFVMESCFAIMK